LFSSNYQYVLLIIKILHIVVHMDAHRGRHLFPIGEQIKK